VADLGLELLKKLSRLDNSVRIPPARRSVLKIDGLDGKRAPN